MKPVICCGLHGWASGVHEPLIVNYVGFYIHLQPGFSSRERLHSSQQILEGPREPQNGLGLPCGENIHPRPRAAVLCLPAGSVLLLLTASAPIWRSCGSLGWHSFHLSFHPNSWRRVLSWAPSACSLSGPLSLCRGRRYYHLLSSGLTEVFKIFYFVLGCGQLTMLLVLDEQPKRLSHTCTCSFSPTPPPHAM